METAEVDRSAIDAFEMPHVRPGATVLYHPQGMRTRHQSVATVIRCNRRGAMVKTAEGHIREAVRHIDDPKLELNADQRENGAWEHTDDYKLLQGLDERLSALEEQFDKKKKGLDYAATLHSEGASMNEIVKKVRTFGVTKVDVLQHLGVKDD